MIFERQEDLDREEKAIKKFVSLFSGTYKKLTQFDLDFEIFLDGKFICFAEVKGRKGRYMDTSYPLPIAVKKLVKIQEKRSNCVLIWSCIDGIVYGKYRRLKGVITFGGMITPREGSTNDREFMAYYEKQEELKTLKY
tara:strand:- start:61 stop:474 length:414 start_codon:yes stop_codon:yes gene_type:complete